MFDVGFRAEEVEVAVFARAFHHIVFKFGGEASIEPIRSLIDITVMVLRGVCVGDHDERFGEGLEALGDEPREGVLFEAFVDAETVEFVELFLVLSLEGVFYQGMGDWSSEGTDTHES